MEGAKISKLRVENFMVSVDGQDHHMGLMLSRPTTLAVMP